MVEPKYITSKDNPRIKEMKKLQSKKYRRKLDQFLIEGAHLVEEAMTHGQKIHALVFLDGYDHAKYDDQEIETFIVNDNVMKTLSSLETPPGIMAVVSYAAPETDGRRVLLLDGIQDPGNLGTLLRTADAFGFGRVILSLDTVDAFSDKVLRSAQGSTFHIDIKSMDAAEAVQDFDGTVLATDPEGAVPLEEAPAGDPLMVILGNEGRGVSDTVLAQVDRKIKIEMPGASESLNVAIAGGIIMHHFKA
ncbi:RNA methyltransferase [Salinicoccus sp. ID82-1]|uniref:TrmH family RNA methyltransferase n=1 Tax=Salinicoccus sp. ID82-1 TaxID=2820269 RepID=UPI001F2AA253|nr:RNA methyltransferase [Salinicoccus sp. ID82-1]MCG1009288.1 RNA methyltransferase [Salinicoccus sp. ID82-1]